MIGLMVLRSALPGAALAACVMFASPAFAETLSFKADLKASEAVPPNDSKGTGTVTASYDTASKKLTWKGNYSGLSGPATMAHFHGPAEPGKNAGVAVPITPSTSPFENSANLTDAGRRPDGRALVRQCPYRRSPRRGNPRPARQVSAPATVVHGSDTRRARSVLRAAPRRAGLSRTQAADLCDAGSVVRLCRQDEQGREPRSFTVRKAKGEPHDALRRDRRRGSDCHVGAACSGLSGGGQ